MEALGGAKLNRSAFKCRLVMSFAVYTIHTVDLLN